MDPIFEDCDFYFAAVSKNFCEQDRRIVLTSLQKCPPGDSRGTKEWSIQSIGSLSSITGKKRESGFMRLSAEFVFCNLQQ